MGATENDQNQLDTTFVTTNHASLSLLWQILLDSADCISKAYLFKKTQNIKDQILSNTEFSIL